MSNLPGAHAVDTSITRVPFDNAADMGWLNDDTRLYRLASPLHGMFGEEADHIVVSVAPSTVTDDEPEVAVFAATPDGDIVGFMPVAQVATADADAVLADLGFTDVTAE